MRYRLAQVVIFTTACMLVGNPHVRAQSCPTPLASHDEQPPAPEISIAEVTFSGYLQLPISDQEQIAASIKKQTYEVSLDRATDEALERVRAGWQDHGYFKVQVNGGATTLTSSSAVQRIALSVHVDEGLQYGLGRIGFKHNKAISDVGALRDLFPIKDREIFSKEKIATGLENLRKAYGQLGYINFTSIPDTKFDDEKKLINLDIDMDEGKQFYVGSINLIGLEEAARQELLEDLPITKGQIFDSRLWELSVLKLGSRLPDCGCADPQMRALDERTGTVALSFDFRPCSGRQ
jgi:outer membrane protein assembly factor BamA